MGEDGSKHSSTAESTSSRDITYDDVIRDDDVIISSVPSAAVAGDTQDALSKSPKLSILQIRLLLMLVI